jgi:DNA-binding MarR family transcriptional regulator
VKPAEQTRYQILAIQREGNRLFAQQLAVAEVTPSQAEVISLLARFGTLSLNALGEMLVCETGDSPSRLISRMVSGGLVEKVKDSNDGRAIVISLTAKGHDVFDSVVKPSEAALHGMIESIFSAPELDELLASLTRLSSALGSDKAIRARIAVERQNDKTR